MTDTEDLRAALGYVERWLRYRAWYLRVPGVQWAVGFDGAVQGGGAIGLADETTREPLTGAHRFRIASHSKTFTAVAVLRLVADGRLRLEAPLGEVLPELADAGIGAVTVRQLLEHGGGVIRDGLDGDHWQHARAFPDLERLLAIAREEGVKQEPELRFAYSNIGYALLGEVIARVAGATFRDAVRASVIEPAGLRRTDPDLVEGVPTAAAHSGLATARTRTRLPHVDTAAMSAATGFSSTAEDVVTLLLALRPGTGALLPDPLKRLQQRPLQETGSGGSYGLGMVVETLAGRRVVGHSGGYPGHITKSVVDPEAGIAVSVLTNSVDGPATELATGVLAILDAAVTRTPSGAVHGDTAPYEGRFAGTWDVVDVARIGDRLLALSPLAANPMTGVDRLEVVDADTLRIAEGDGYGSVGETVRYERDADGGIARVRIAASTALPFDVDGADSWRPPFPAEG